MTKGISVRSHTYVTRLKMNYIIVAKMRTVFGANNLHLCNFTLVVNKILVILKCIKHILIAIVLIILLYNFNIMYFKRL